MTFNINAQLVLRPPTNVAQIGTQIRNQLNNINAGVNITVSQRGQRGVNQVNNSLGKTAKGAKDAGDRIKYFGEQIGYATKRFFAFSVGTAAILRFVGALKQGVSEAIAFEREMIKVAQVTGRTIKGVDGLAKEITRLSKGLGVASSDLVQASRVLAQTGISADEVKTALEALAKSDLAPTFDNINNTTEASIAIFRQFGKEAKDLEGILGSINAVAGRFAVESSDISAAVRRTGGAFAAAGGDLNELIALFTSVRATTRESAESIATGFRTIFTRLQRVRTQNFLETVGINLKNLEGQFIGPFEAVRKLSAALEELPSTDPRFAQIVEELGGFRQVSKVIPLVQQFGTAEKALGVALAGTNSLTEDSELAQQSLANQLRKTREAFVAMIRELTNTSTFRDLVALALSAANAFIKMAEALKPLLPLLVGLGGLAIGKLLPTVFAGIKNVPGLNKGGMVDVVLTPGERVFTPSEVNQVGLKNLEKANRRGFATGGFVPGTGNRDTVPAVLPEGSFVLRKSVSQQLAKGGETKKQSSASIARVFDFDDTLAKTDKEKRPGPATVNTARTTAYTEVARRAAKAGHDIYVLTARASDSRDPIQQFASRAGISIPSSRIITVANDPELANLREPGAKPGTTRKMGTSGKKQVILSRLSGQYDRVVFYDDDKDNILKAGKIGKVQTVMAGRSGKSLQPLKRNRGGIVGLPKFNIGGRKTLFRPNERVATKAIPDFEPKQSTDPKAGRLISIKDPGPDGYGAVISEARSTKAKGGSKQGVQPRISITNLTPAFSRVGKKDALQKYQLGIVQGGQFNTTPGSSVGFSFPIGFVKPESEKRIQKDTVPQLDNIVIKTAKGVFPSATIKKTPLPNLQAVIGSIFEGMIRSLGAPFSDETDRQNKNSAIWDFPTGIKQQASYLFDSTEVRNIPTDAKVSLNAAQNGLKGKVENTIADKLASSPGKAVNGFVLRKKLGPIGPQTRPKTKGAKGGLMKFADGGMVPNALLTPGERVFSPEEVSQIGLGNLERANRMGFADGGGVYSYPGFKPSLTTRGKAGGNVGRKKQKLEKLIKYLEGLLQSGQLDAEGKRYLRGLKARESKGVERSRNYRYGHRMSVGMWPRPAVPFKRNRGGLIGLRSGGTVRKYAAGGGILGGGGAGTIAAFSLATGAISSMVGQMDSANESFQNTINVLTSMGAQVGVITLGLTSLGKTVTKTSKRMDISNRRLEGARTRLVSDRAALKKATDPQEQQRLQQNISNHQKSIDAQKATIKSTQKLEKVMGGAALAVGIFSSAALAYGTYLEKVGRADVEAGGRGEALRTAGKAKGAGQGIAAGGAAGLGIGFLVGGPIGAAIGVVITIIGGAIGSLIGDFFGKQAQFDAVQARDLGKAAQELGYRFKDLSDGLITFDQILPNVQDTVNTFRTQLADPRTTAESRKNLRAQAAQQLEGFNKVISESTKTVVKNNNAGDKVAQVYALAGRDLIRFTAELQGISYERAEQQIRNNIIALEEAREAQDKLSKLTDQYSERIKNITNLSRAFDTVALSLKKFESDLSTTLDFAGGGTGAFQLFDESARLATPQNFFDAEGFNRVLQRDIENNFVLQTRFPGATQDAGQQLAGDASQAEAAIRNLPAILLNLRNSAGSFDPDDTIKQLVDKFAVPGQDPNQKTFVQSTIEKAAREVLGSEGKPQKFIDELNKDLPGLAKKLGAGFDDILKVTAQISKSLADEGNRRLKLVDTITKLTDQEIALRQRGIDLQSNAEDLRARAGNRSTDLNRLQQLDNQRLTTIAGGGPVDPTQIGRDVREAQDRISQIQEDYARTTAQEGTDANRRLNDELKKQRETVLRGNQALDFLSNVSDRAATVMEAFSREQAIANARLGLIDRAISAETPKEIMQFTRELAQARMAVADGRIDRVRPQDRQEVFNFLKSLPDNFELGGQTIKDALIDIRTNFLADRGFDPQEARRIAVGQTEKSNQLQTQLEAIIKTAEEAYSQQVTTFENSQTKIIQALDTSIKTFTQTLKDIINKQTIDDLVGEQKGVQGSVDSIKAAQDAFTSLAQRFDGTDQRAQNIGRRREDIRSLVTQRQNKADNEAFANRILKSDVYANQLVPGSPYGALTENTLGIQTSRGTIKELLGQNYAIDRDFAQKIFDQQIQQILNNSGLNAEGAKNASLAFQETFNKGGGLATGSTVNLREFGELMQAGLEAAARRIEQDYSGEQRLTSSLANLNLSDRELALFANDDTYKKIQEEWDKFANYVQNNAVDTIKLLDTRMSEFSGKMDKINKQLADFGITSGDDNQRGGIIGFNKGGVVPGVGNRDSVLAALTPGEVILPKMQNGGDPKKLLEQIQQQMAQTQQSKREDSAALVTRLDQQADTIRENRQKKVQEYVKNIAEYKPDYGKDAEGNALTKEQYLANTQKQMAKTARTRQANSFANILRRNRGEKVEAAPEAKPRFANDEDRQRFEDVQKQRREAKQNRLQKLGRLSSEDRRKKLGRISDRRTRQLNMGRILSKPLTRDEQIERGLQARAIAANRTRGEQRPIEAAQTREFLGRGITRATNFISDAITPIAQRVRSTTQGFLGNIRQSFLNYQEKRQQEKARFNAAMQFIGSGRELLRPQPRLSYKPRSPYKTYEEAAENINRQVDLNRGLGRDAIKTPEEIKHLKFAGEAYRRYKAGKTSKEIYEKIVKDHAAKYKVAPYLRFQTGAMIPGTGSGDKIHVMAEPGEYIFNRQAVKAIGKENLDNMNFNKFPRFQRGGPVKMQQGGETPQTAAASMPDFTFFNEIIQKFGNKVDLLAETMNSINGLSIEHHGNFKHEIIINGAQVLTEIMPQVTQIVEEKISASMNRVLKDNFNGKAGTYE
jgi:TP901 family phage tail tape measure protein